MDQAGNQLSISMTCASIAGKQRVLSTRRLLRSTDHSAAFEACTSASSAAAISVLFKLSNRGPRMTNPNLEFIFLAAEWQGSPGKSRSLNSALRTPCRLRARGVSGNVNPLQCHHARDGSRHRGTRPVRLSIA
jgi:hypothetical protein